MKETKQACIILIIFISIICNGCHKTVVENTGIESEETSNVFEVDESVNTVEKKLENTTEMNAESKQTNTEGINVDNSQETEYYKATGYVLSVEEDIMYVDEENDGSRSYPEEGEDRKIAYDISEANINVAQGVLRRGLTVNITYYEENSQRYAVYIQSNGWENPPGLIPPADATYGVEGTIQKISENTIVIRYEDPETEGTYQNYIMEEFDIRDAVINTSIELKEFFSVYIVYQKKNEINKAIEIRDIS